MLLFIFQLDDGKSGKKTTRVYVLNCLPRSLTHGNHHCVALTVQRNDLQVRSAPEAQHLRISHKKGEVKWPKF